MKKLFDLFAIVAVMIVFVACGGSNGDSNKDSEKESVKTVTIGKQVWMAENLNVDKFRNGDPIPEAKTDDEWEEAGKNNQPAWCYYNNNPDNGDRYGKLYNWYAVNDPRGLAPEGWKIPSDEDWIRLTDYLGGDKVAAKKMKSIDFWADNDGESGNGTNESGFSGYPGGCYSNGGGFYYIGEGFYYIGEGGYWWSSTECGSEYAWYRYIYYDNDFVKRKDADKGFGYSVRCIKE